MNFKKHWSLVATLALMAASSAGCVEWPFLGGGQPPTIQSFDYEPKQEVYRKGSMITLRIAGLDPEGRTVLYNWTTTKGSLSAATGETVNWFATKADGTFETGTAIVTVTLSDGFKTYPATFEIEIDAEGNARVKGASQIAIHGSSGASSSSRRTTRPTIEAGSTTTYRHPSGYYRLNVNKGWNAAYDTSKDRLVIASNNTSGARGIVLVSRLTDTNYTDLKRYLYFIHREATKTTTTTVLEYGLTYLCAASTSAGYTTLQTTENWSSPTTTENWSSPTATETWAPATTTPTDWSSAPTTEIWSSPSPSPTPIAVYTASPIPVYSAEPIPVYTSAPVPVYTSAPATPIYVPQPSEQAGEVPAVEPYFGECTGLEAGKLVTRVQTEEGELTILSYLVFRQGVAYNFTAMSVSTAYESYRTSFEAICNSVQF